MQVLTRFFLWQPSGGAGSQSQAMTVVQRPASSPSIVKLPANQMPHVIRQQGAQVVTNASGAASTPGRTKIITVKRVGPNGSVTQSRSFTISADAAAGLAGTPKIIVQKPNGTTQVARTGSPAPVKVQQVVSQNPGTIKLPISVVQAGLGSTTITNQNISVSNSGNTPNSFESQFQQFAQSFQSNSNVSVNAPDTTQVKSSVIGQPHVIQISRPISTTINPVVARTIPATARLVSSQTVLNTASPSIRVIQRPFQNCSGGTPTLQHSQSVPANMTAYNNITNIPTHLLGSRETDSPPLVVSRQPLGLGTSKLALNDIFPNEDLENPIGMSSLSAMHRTVQSIPVPKIANITSRDVSRMWSNQDIRLKNITSNAVSINSV